jgi:hypothetical protein
MRTRFLSPDPAEGGAPAAGDPPASPKVVAKTPPKNPAQISLERKVAAVEDKLGAIEGWQGEVNKFLEDFLPAGGKPKRAPAPGQTPAQPSKSRHEIDSWLAGA